MPLAVGGAARYQAVGLLASTWGRSRHPVRSLALLRPYEAQLFADRPRWSSERPRLRRALLLRRPTRAQPKRVRAWFRYGAVPVSPSASFFYAMQDRGAAQPPRRRAHQQGRHRHHRRRLAVFYEQYRAGHAAGRWPIAGRSWWALRFAVAAIIRLLQRLPVWLPASITTAGISTITTWGPSTSRSLATRTSIKLRRGRPRSSWALCAAELDQSPHGGQRTPSSSQRGYAQAEMRDPDKKVRDLAERVRREGTAARNPAGARAGHPRATRMKCQGLVHQRALGRIQAGRQAFYRIVSVARAIGPTCRRTTASTRRRCGPLAGKFFADLQPRERHLPAVPGDRWTFFTSSACSSPCGGASAGVCSPWAPSSGAANRRRRSYWTGGAFLRQDWLFFSRVERGMHCASVTSRRRARRWSTRGCYASSPAWW